jgi:LPXTG-motif cell wall-anchored protein
MKTCIQTTIFFVLICSTLLFQNCSSVSSVKPLPTDDSSILREFPASFEGNFKYVPSKGGDEDKQFGQLFLKLVLTDAYKLAVTSYYSFDEALLKKNAKYYRVQGDLLIYKNDSLSSLKRKLEDKKSTYKNLSSEEDYQLEKLATLEEDGKIFKTYPVTKKNGKYTYNEQLVYNIDLKTNQMTMYYENTAPNEKKCVFKKYGDYYFLNMFNEKSKDWTCGIFQEKSGNLVVSSIDFGNLRDQSDFYKNIANIVEIKKYDIVIDPSESQFKSLMEDANFLEEFAVLQRTSTSVGMTNYIWYILIAVILITGGIFMARKRKNATT